MKNMCALIIAVSVFPSVALGQGSQANLKSITSPSQPGERSSPEDLKRAAAISLAQNTAAEAPLWNDKKISVAVLTDAADLLWEENPGPSAKWLTRAWSLIDQVSESPRNEKLKGFFNHSDKSDLRSLVICIARKHDVDLAEDFLKQLIQKQPGEKKERGAFDDRTAQSEQLLALAQWAIDSDPDLAFGLAQRSLVDGLSYNLQNVLTALRNKNVDLANRLFDLALARFATGVPEPSQAEVLAGYLFQSGFTFSANSTGQPILVVNPAQQTFPAVAPREPQRAKAFLIAVYHTLLSRPLSISAPDGRQRAQQLLVLGERLTGFYNIFAPQLAQPAAGFVAQLQSQLSIETTATPKSRQSAPNSESSTKDLSDEELYEKHLAALEKEAAQENDPILKKLAYVEAALAARPEDFNRAKRIALNIDDPELRADAVSFVLYRAALLFIEKGEIEKAIEMIPSIESVPRRSVVRIALAQRLVTDKSGKVDPAEVDFARERALNLLSEIDRDLKKDDPSPNTVKILLGRTAVLANLDPDQALASLDQIVELINKLDQFDLRNATAPNLGMGGFSASGATLAGPRVGFDFRSAIDPFIVTDFDQISALAQRFASRETSGIARLEAAKLYLNKVSRPTPKPSAKLIPSHR